MSRISLGLTLALGFCLTACENASAQEHPGWPQAGSLSSSATPQATQNSSGGASAGTAEHRGWPAEGSLHWTPGQQPSQSDNANAGSAEHRGWPADGSLGWSQQQRFSTNPQAAAPDWRYVFHNGRWWYWMPNSRLDVLGSWRLAELCRSRASR